MNRFKLSERTFLKELIQMRLRQYEHQYGPLRIPKVKTVRIVNIGLLVILGLLMLDFLFTVPPLGILFLGLALFRIRRLIDAGSNCAWILKEAKRFPDTKMDQIIAGYYGKSLSDDMMMPPGMAMWQPVFSVFPETPDYNSGNTKSDDYTGVQEVEKMKLLQNQSGLNQEMFGDVSKRRAVKRKRGGVK